MKVKKAKIGRPKVKDERKHKINVRLNDREFKLLKKYLKKNKIDEVSPFIRKLVVAKVSQLKMFENTKYESTVTAANNTKTMK